MKTGFYEKGQVTKNQKLIIENYKKNNLFLDIIVIIVLIINQKIGPVDLQISKMSILHRIFCALVILK